MTELGLQELQTESDDPQGLQDQLFCVITTKAAMQPWLHHSCLCFCVISASQVSTQTIQHQETLTHHIGQDVQSAHAAAGDCNC